MNRHKDIIHLIYNIAKTRKTALEVVGITNLPNIPSLNSLPRDFWDANFLLVQILDSIDSIAATENILFGVEFPSGLPNQVLATNSSGVEVNQVTLRGLELSDLPGIDNSKIISGISWDKISKTGAVSSDVGADPTGSADTAISSHEAASDPHPGYVLNSELTAHEATNNHPGLVEQTITGWSFNTAWSNYRSSYPDFQIRKVGNMVNMYGMIARGSGTTNTSPIINLPSSVLPSGWVRTLAEIRNNNVMGIIVVYVNPGGSVNLTFSIPPFTLNSGLSDVVNFININLTYFV